MNVLAFCFLPIASVRVGVGEIIEFLVENNQMSYRYKDTLQVTSQDIKWADLVICIRGSEPGDLTILEQAVSLDKKCMYYLDDDLFNIPSYAACYPYYQDPVIRGRMERLMELCQCLWTNNPRIAEKYKNYFDDVIITEVPVKMVEKKEQVKALKVGFAGGNDHTHFINQLLKKPIKRLLDRNSYVRFEFVGAKLDLEHPRVHFQPHLDFSEYKDYIKDRGWSIGLAPLQDSEFHSCKYYNKFLEYSSLGIAGIYSSVLPYKSIVENQITGMLIPNNQQVWYRTISQLIRNSYQRGRIMKNSMKVIEENFNYNVICQDFMTQLSKVYGEG